MTQEEFLKKFDIEVERMKTIVKAKNADYAEDVDAFKNFNSVKVLGITPEQGILVRKMDKNTRISNLLSRPPQVKDEAIGDTCLDDAIYSVILKIMVENR